MFHGDTLEMKKITFFSRALLTYRTRGCEGGEPPWPPKWGYVNFCRKIAPVQALIQQISSNNLYDQRGCV